MFYIFNASRDQVWAHHGIPGELPNKGLWASDIDAEYADNVFGYSNRARALAKRRELKEAFPGEVVELKSRAELFDEIGVADWSQGA